MGSPLAPPSTASDQASVVPRRRLVSVSRLTAPIDGSASPRKPSERMRRRSSSGSFEVQCRSTASASSSALMPSPSSVTAIRLCPPSRSASSMRPAPASIEFSISSFTAEAGRSTTSPAAMRLTRTGGSCRMRMRLLCAAAPRFAKILPRKHLALLDGGLVEGIDPQQIGGDDGLQHEMHEERAEALLIESLESHHPSRASVAQQARRRGALLGGQQIAHAASGEIGESAVGGEIGRQRGARALLLQHQQGKELVRGTAEIELKLAVLIDDAESTHGRRALAVLAETLGPELPIPEAEGRQPIDIGHEHADVDA